MSIFLCVKVVSHCCREVAWNNRSCHPCQGLIWRQIFGQRWLPWLLLNGCEQRLARSRRGCVAEKGANPTDDGLQSSRAPCGSEMIGRTYLNVASNRNFHCLLLLCLGLRQSRAFFANKQVVPRCIPGLCHPFLLLRKKSYKALNIDLPLRPNCSLYLLTYPYLWRTANNTFRRGCGVQGGEMKWQPAEKFL